uniref:Disease resistance protein winged helix domain-containing protein n=1 Tax=Oryza glumipatula TaxID=40148 RepID=A0A0D9ZJP0_9ORYZ
MKRCFSICALYPKDHRFEKEFLADIWVAQGYVEAEDASSCFDDLVNRSFFQKADLSDKYVIHDLMHDTAQLVSEGECFIIQHSLSFFEPPFPDSEESKNIYHLEVLHIRRSLTSICVSEASSRHPVGVFSSLSNVTVSLCNSLLSLDEFLMPAYMPIVKIIHVESCRQLALLPIDELHSFSRLEELRIEGCPKLNMQRRMTLPSSLRKLRLINCPSIEYIDNSHLGSSMTLKGLSLRLDSCPDLISIVGAISVSEIQSGDINDCPKLMEITQPITRRPYWR